MASTWTFRTREPGLGRGGLAAAVLGEEAAETSDPRSETTRGAEEQGRQGPARPAPPTSSGRLPGGGRRCQRPWIGQQVVATPLTGRSRCHREGGARMSREDPLMGTLTGRRGNQTPAPLPCFRSLLPGLQLDLGSRATLPLPGRRRGRGFPMSSNTFPSRWIFHKPCPTLVGSRCLVKCFPVRSVWVQWKALPGDAGGEEFACSVGDRRGPGSIPGLGRSPGEGNGSPTLFLPGESHG